MRGCRLALIALLVGPLQAGRAQAVPPPGAAVGGTQLEVQHWIEHRVIMGERLAEIARRYRVEVADVAEWNGLDAQKPMLKAGQRLRVLTTESAAERRRRSYVVREGDTWTRIANRFGVPLSRLRNQWNPGVAEPVPGDTIVLFVEVGPKPTPDDDAPPRVARAAAPARVVTPAPARAASPAPARVAEPSPRSSQSEALAAVVELQPSTSGKRSQGLAAVVTPPATTARDHTSAKPDANSKPSTLAPPAAAVQSNAKQQPLAKLQPNAAAHSTLGPGPGTPSPDLPLVAVPSGGLSAGAPSRGRLINGVQIPLNDALYTIRNPDNSWGSSHAIEQLQRAIARFRQDSGFEREILICDMSRKRGGRFRPHASHRSGRDVDIQLPVKLGFPPGHIPRAIAAVDWDAAWALVRALVSTGEVKYIFLSRSRQRPLYQAALRAGETVESLAGFIQFPTNEKTALLRHSQGHVKHLHVRFKCAVHEARCVE